MNYNEFLYEVSVVVYKTGTQVLVKSAKGYDVKDPHLVGTLEIAKQTVLDKMSERKKAGEPLNIPTTQVEEKFQELPSTIEEAIEYLLPRFEGMEEYFEEMNEDEFASFCHSQQSGGIGMKIRNEFGFWTKDTAIYKDISERHPQLTHPDDMSDLIIRAVYQSKKNDQNRNHYPA